MNFDIKISPESQKKLEALARAGKVDLRPTLRVIGTGYRKEVGMIFDKQQPRGAGLRWQALSEDYAEWKERNYPGRPLLVRTGALKESMTVEGATGNITTIGKTGAVFGSNIAYGIYHDSDGSRTGKLPRRNFSEPSERRRMIWEQQITDGVKHSFEVNGIEV